MAGGALNKEIMKTFINYYGGKFRIAKMYGEPSHNLIIEPFAGAAGYSLRHYKKKVKLYEKDINLYSMWDFLIKAKYDEIMCLPLDFETLDDLTLPIGAKNLIGFCLNTGVSSPCKTRSKWARERPDSVQFWGERRRKRVAEQVGLIKHWECSLVDTYQEIPNEESTWFIDPPYEGAGKFYNHGSDGIIYDELGNWCLSRLGEVIVCENASAIWLPWTHSKSTKSNNMTKVSDEVWYHKCY